MVSGTGADGQFSWDAARTELGWSGTSDGLNIARVAVDRHAEGPHRDRTAFRWLGENGDIRQMALVLTDPPGKAREQRLYGAVRISADPDNERAEFAILLRGDMTGMGLGPLLMRRIIDYSRNRGIRQLYGDVLAENAAMLALARAFGFTVKPDPEDPGVMIVTLDLAGG